MISVTDLLFWAEKAAIGRSASQPRGWVSGDALRELADAVKEREPLNYDYRDNPDYPAGHCFTVTKCEKCGEYYEASYEHACRKKNSYPPEGLGIDPLA